MGFLFGLLASSSFGLIPLFTLPLMHSGMSVETVLFYRFFFAAIALGIFLALRHERFHLRFKHLAKAGGVSFMYTTSALLYFWGLSFAPSGLATTIHFVYPVMVMLIMTLFYHEKFSILTLIAVLLAMAGVALLSGVGAEVAPISLAGILIILTSALANGFYIVGIFAARIPHISGLMLTFHVLCFGSVYSGLNSLLRGSFQIIENWEELFLLLGLAIVTAVLSNVALVLAVKRIGSTLTSVLGAMEPLTAVIIGVLVFHEQLTPPLAGGIAMILSAVIIIMLGPQMLHFVERKLCLARANKR